MNKNVKIGLIFASAWVLFLLVLFGMYLLLSQKNPDYFVDEETGGLISSMFFIAWLIIWYGIGYHISKDYNAKFEIFADKHRNDKAKEITFRKFYFSRIAKMLSVVFLCTIPAYIITLKDEQFTITNFVVVFVLLTLSSSFYLYYRSISRNELKHKNN